MAVYCPESAKVVAEGDQIRLVTVYCAGLFGTSAESETGTPPVTGATNPFIPADVMGIVDGATAAGK